MDTVLKVIDHSLDVLGLLVVLGMFYVRVTPSKTDDEWFAKMERHPVVGPAIKFLIRFSPVERRKK